MCSTYDEGNGDGPPLTKLAIKSIADYVKMKNFKN